MSAGKEGGIHVGGGISGHGIVVGHGSSATVTITQGDRNQISRLIGTLREDVQRAALPDGSKKVLLEQAIPEMERATKEPDPKPKLESALGKINTVLESVDATAESTGGLLDKLQQVAAHAGIALGTAAPLVAKLLGG